MSLRAKLLIAAAGIVAVSLSLSGALTFLLVRSSELDAAQGSLIEEALRARAAVQRAQCAVVATATCPAGQVTSVAVYQTRLERVAELLPAGDRLLLLDRERNVVFDSGGSARGQRLGAVARPGARLVNVTLNSQPYLGAAVPLGRAARDPYGAVGLVLVRPRGEVAGTAISQLVPRLLLAGALALAVALLIALFLSRAITRPLSELVRASDDIASGNYARRVTISGQDEVGVLGSAFNRMAAAVEQARTSQRDFLANLSHELKTPLTSLIGFSEALMDGSLAAAPDRYRAAVVIHEEAERVLRLADELLDLARVEGGQVRLEPSDVDLAALLRQLVEVSGPRASSRSLRLTLRLEPQLPPVRADPDRLHQILDNLLDNALKYSAPGGEVTAAAWGAEGRVLVSVTNPVQRAPDPERIFERFYRGDPSRASGLGGVGLGLAISRELAAAQGGRLWADADGAGHFRIQLSLPTARIG